MSSFNDYKEQGGLADEAGFNARLKAAQAKVNYLIYPNVPCQSNQSAYNNAVYALIDAMEQGYGASISGGFRIGNFSLDADATSSDTPENDLTIIKPYLVGTGLLYMGLA